MEQYNEDCRMFSKKVNRYTGNTVTYCEGLKKLECKNGGDCSFYKPVSKDGAEDFDKIMNEISVQKSKSSPKIFASNLRKILDMRGKTKVWLSTNVGVMPYAVGTWCKGESYPNAANIKAISKALNVSISCLFANEEDKNA